LNHTIDIGISERDERQSDSLGWAGRGAVWMMATAALFLKDHVNAQLVKRLRAEEAVK
jgi:hypothetical protein